MAPVPPAISVSVPASAALAPPVMPQSTYSRPVALVMRGKLARRRGMRCRQIDEHLPLVRLTEQPAGLAENGADLRRAGHNEDHSAYRTEGTGLDKRHGR